MILVTGGTGNVGGAVIRQLLERGETVRHFGPTIHTNKHVESYPGDIRNLAQVREACEGVDGIIHTASLVDLHLGEPARMIDINEGGVANLISACREHKIRRISHMSSAEAVSGVDPLHNAGEDVPYPRPHLTYYGVTKEAGERLILAANDSELATCAFRTYGIYGEGDRNFVTFAMKKAMGNSIPVIGKNEGRTNVTYSGNVAHGLILGLNHLEPGAEAGGQAFNVTDDVPEESVQDFVINALKPIGFKQAAYNMPMPVAKGLIKLFEGTYGLTKSDRFAYPVLTNHQLLLASGDYYLDLSKIKRILGYSPKYSREEALARTQKWLVETYG